MPSAFDLLTVLRDMRSRLDGDLTLTSVAKRAGWSPFHLHRELRATLGETPKQYALRLRLSQAGALLAATDRPIGDVAIAAGFTSHAVFARAFRRRFGCSAAQYRAAALAGGPPEQWRRHLVLTREVVPCIGLYRMTTTERRRATMATLSIEIQDRPEVPVLLIRRRTARDKLAATIGECFGALYAFAHKAGLADTGRPTVRYLSVGPGLWTIEACKPTNERAAGEGAIEPGALAGGTTAVALHAGPYDELQSTYTALEQWMEQNGWRPNGSPWEVYVNDPAECPDPTDWRTEVCWPIAKS